MPEFGEQPDPNDFMTDEMREHISALADDVLSLYPEWKQALEDGTTEEGFAPDASRFTRASAELFNSVHTPKRLLALSARQLEAYKGAYAMEFFAPGTRAADSIAQYPGFDELQAHIARELEARELPQLPEGIDGITALYNVWTKDREYLTQLFAALPSDPMSYRELNADLGRKIAIMHLDAAQEMKDV